MEGGVPEGFHLAWPANPKGEESQVDSTLVAGHPPSKERWESHLE